MLADAAVNPRNQLVGWLAIGVAALTPLVAFLSPLGLTPLLILLALAAMTFGPRAAILRAIPRGTLILAAALLLWAAISASWAIEPLVSIRKAGQLLALFAAGLVALGFYRGALDGEARAAAKLGLAWGVVALLGLFAVELIFGAPYGSLFVRYPGATYSSFMNYHDRSATILAIFLVPASLFMYQRHGRLAGGCVLFSGLIMLSLSYSRTAAAAAFAAAAVGAAAAVWPRLMQRLAVVGLVMMVCFGTMLPLLLPDDPARLATVREEAMRFNVFSLFHRLRIWEFAVDRIEEKPYVGWGLDSSRSIAGGQQMTDAAGERMPLHPHNAPLQVRLELGLPGLVLAGALVLWPIIFLRRYGARAEVAILATASAAGIVASLSYGIWQSWWVAALWLTAALISIAGSPEERER